MGRAFSTSYLAREAAACSFLPADFREHADRMAAARRAAQRVASPALIEVLREQQSQFPAHEARRANLEALAQGRTAVVVTGQQVGLFLGPLYAFYKAASAIVAARSIESETGVRCVPLFWLQTEDHDFAEIATCTVATAEGTPLSLALADEPATAARVSVAHRRLGPEVPGLIDALAVALGPDVGTAEVVKTLREHYVPGRTLAAAFAGTLAAIFADEGLLFLDPRDARIAEMAAPLYRRALRDAKLIDSTLAGRATELAHAGFTEQVGLRPGSPLVFFHRDTATGPRFRLHRSTGAPQTGGPSTEPWTLTGAGQTISEDALLETLARDPLRFSTSALLRPIVQDTLLPTVAYVGGPAEVSYFAQVTPLYPHFDLSPPLCIPRARFRCVDARSRRLLAALGLEPDDLVRPADELLSRLALGRLPGAAAPAELERRTVADIMPLVDEIAAAVVSADPALLRAAQRTRTSVARALGRLTARYARGLLERDTTTRDRLRRLKDALFPGGVPQERVFGWPTLAARFGPATFKSLVLESLEATSPFATDLRELRP